jgi:phage tail-like protein
MATNLNASKFKIKIDSKEYGDCTYFGGSRLTIDALTHRDTDGRKGVITRSGDVSFSTVVIRRPFAVGDSTFMDWVQNTRKTGAEKNKKTVGITVLDEDDSAKLEYTLNNAWPTSYSHTPLVKDGGAGGSARVIEEVTLVIEDIEYKAL